MNRINNKYAKDYVQKTFIDSLEEDGAFCDYYSKYYLEEETLKGGIGNRLAFKNYNDRISQFHNILQILTGERRANIYEALPAIDFMKPSNTSFLNTYPLTERGINPKEIIAINASVGENSLQLLEMEDKYTINRALAGLPIAEHFYNTTELLSSEYNLQVSPYKGMCDYIYQGIITPRSMQKGVVSSKVRKTKIMYFKSVATTEVYFNAKSPNIDPESRVIGGKTLYYDKVENTLTGNLEATDYIILNSDCGWSEKGLDNVELYTPIKHENKNLINITPEEYSKYIGQYSLSIDPNDILIALPKDSYSLGCSKILLLKYNEPSNLISKRDVATVVYYRNETGKFYTDPYFNNLLKPSVGKYYVDAYFESKNEYYIYDTENSQFITSPKNDYEEVTVFFNDNKTVAYSDLALTEVVTPSNKILYKDGLACTRVAYSYNPETLILGIDRGVTLEQVGNTYYAEYTVTPSEYTCYVLYIDSFDSGFSLSSGFQEINVGDKINSLMENTSVANILKKYLLIEKNYVASASGLLDGFFCEPVEYTESPVLSRSVTKWKFVNEVDEAQKNGVSIEVGSKYYSGHLLGRGNILDSPFKLTAHDASESYNGKAELIYDKLKDFNIHKFILDRASVSLWNSLTSFIRIPVAQRVTSLITKFNYVDKSKMKNSDALDLGSNANKEEMLYPKKFYIDSNTLIDINDIDTYIDFFDTSFNEDNHTLYLDLRDTDYIVSSYRMMVNKEGSCDKEGSPQHKEGQDFGNDTQNKVKLKENFSTCFSISYDVHKKKDDSTYEDAFENFSISMITPRELFKKKSPKLINTIYSLFNPYYSDTSNDVTVVFPEYNKYFPEYVYIFSRYDLDLKPFDTSSRLVNLNEKNICSFLSGDGQKVLTFKVDKVTKILPSKVYKVEIYDPKTGQRSTKSLQGTNKPLIEGYKKNYTYIPTEDTSFDNYKTYYRKNEATESEPYESYTIISKKRGNPKKKGYYEVKTSDERDCYVYKLSYFNVPVSQKIHIYDWEDKELEIKDMNLPGKLIGLSCDLDGSNYFKLEEKMEDGVKVYVVPESHRNSDFDTLSKSYIVGGLPSIGDKNFADFKVNLGGKQVSLEVFDSLFSKDDDLTTRAIRNIIFNWPLSDDKNNPITMCDLPEVLNGIINCKQSLVDLGKVDFTIKVKGTPVTLNEESFMNLISIIDTDRNVNFYNVNVGYNSSTISSLLDSLQLYSKDGSYVIKTDKDNYTGTTYTPNELIANGESIPKIYEAIIQKVISSSLYINGVDTPTGVTRRRSLLNIYNQIKGIFDGTRTLTREACKELDNLFGNNTLAFLNIGSQYSVDNRLITYTPQMDILQNKLVDSIINLITDAINSMYNKKSQVLRDNALKEVRDVFKLYYTDSSVNSCVTLGTSSINVNYLGLVINTKTNSSRQVFGIIKEKYDPYSSRNLLIKLFTRLFNKKSIWAQHSLDSFIFNFYEKLSIFDLTRISITNYFRKETQKVINSALSKYSSKVKVSQVSKEDVRALMMGGTVGESDNPIYLADYYNEDEDSIGVSYTTNNRLAVKIIPPIVRDTVSDGVVTSISLTKGSKNFVANHFKNVFDDNIDVTNDTMWGLVDYIKTNLEGTNPNNENNPYYVKYVGEEDSEVIGRPNSLYYRRYKMLNNRMNRLTGPLWKASSTLRNTRVLNSYDSINDSTIESYEPYIEVMPISSMENLLYMPTREGALSSDVLKGKFYSQEEIDAMREQINNKCVLTCTKCTIQDSCPFYDKEEIIKQYCSGIESIDIWVKDNKLDLIHYDSDDASPTLISEDSNEGIDLSKLSLIHKPYSEIEKRFGVSEEINDLSSVREELKENTSLRYEDFVRDDMGWLLGARYGTVQKNNMKDMLINNEEYSTIVDKIHPYSYMYDALFIEDEESYINYSPSKHRYNVEFEMGKPGEKRHYKGNTKLEIPSSLKIFYNNSMEDDVYLISDDSVDSNGEPILPVIYLGKIKNISYVFDLTDDGIEGGVTDPLDRKLYANDVAQWCMNYYKGNLYEYPIGEDSNGVTDAYRDKDQFWMDKVYKQIGDRWYSFSGRKREQSGYSVPLIDVNEFDDILAVSGRPMTANYINFLRKVSIRIYDRETQEWLIPWVNENLPIKDMNKYFKGFSGNLEKIKEKQRCVLPLMKTNLRLAVVKN